MAERQSSGHGTGSASRPTARSAQQPAAGVSSQGAQGVVPVQTGHRRSRSARESDQPARRFPVLPVLAGAAVLIVLCVWLVACSGLFGGEEGLGYELTGGTAATVNGEELLEDDVTIYIMTLREAGGYDTDETWAAYLEEVGLTSAEFRANVIGRFVTQILVAQAAEAYGLSVSEEEVEAAWAEAAAAYESEDAFIAVIEELGYTEETYREAIEATLLTEELVALVAEESGVEVDDSEVLSYFNTNITTYNDARRSSHILFAVAADATEDEIAAVEEEAQEVLELIQSGELSFEDAVATYSDDADTVDAAGDMGWDKTNTLPAAYQEALEGLSEGGTALVQLSDGFHIIQCTDTFYTTSSASSLDDIPTEIAEFVRARVETEAADEVYYEWLEEYTAAAEIVIYEMPEAVPYNVDTGEDEAEAEGEEADETAEDTGDEDAAEADEAEDAEE